MAAVEVQEAVRLDHLPDCSVNQPHDSVGIRRTFAKRKIIFRQGDQATHLYRVESGALALELFVNDGRRQLAEVLLPGDICGFSVDGSYHETAIALVPTALCVMRQSDLERVRMAGWDVAHQAGRQIARTHDHLLALGRKTAQERICQLLLGLAGVIGQCECGSPCSCSKPIHLRVPMTRGDIGDYLGLSLETVCRTMSALQKQGVIRIGPRQGHITLVSPDKVRNLAG